MMKKHRARKGPIFFVPQKRIHNLTRPRYQAAAPPICPGRFPKAFWHLSTPPSPCSGKLAGIFRHV